MAKRKTRLGETHTIEDPEIQHMSFPLEELHLPCFLRADRRRGTTNCLVLRTTNITYLAMRISPSHVEVSQETLPKARNNVPLRTMRITTTGETEPERITERVFDQKKTQVGLLKDLFLPANLEITRLHLHQRLSSPTT